jgi:hypothetical protein
MTLDQVVKARQQAARFVSMCRELERGDDLKTYTLGMPLFGSKRTSAVRRASMDLTRALSEMRK